MNAFFVVVLDSSEKRSRTWGFYTKLEAAEQCVRENWTDIYECGYYDLALIEEMPEGACAIAVSSRWYSVKYQGRELNTYAVEPIECPPQFSHVCNLSIG
jgi:hypothetical protein